MGTDLTGNSDHTPVPSGESARVRDIGHIRGEPTPCRCTFNCQYEDYQSRCRPLPGLAIGRMIALLTLLLKAFIEWRQERSFKN